MSKDQKVTLNQYNAKYTLPTKGLIRLERPKSYVESAQRKTCISYWWVNYFRRIKKSFSIIPKQNMYCYWGVNPSRWTRRYAESAQRKTCIRYWRVNQFRRVNSHFHPSRSKTCIELIRHERPKITMNQRDVKRALPARAVVWKLSTKYVPSYLSTPFVHNVKLNWTWYERLINNYFR